eukprot:6423643-Amphidinium_carterae.2
MPLCDSTMRVMVDKYHVRMKSRSSQGLCGSSVQCAECASISSWCKASEMRVKSTMSEKRMDTFEH